MHCHKLLRLRLIGSNVLCQHDDISIAGLAVPQHCSATTLHRLIKFFEIVAQLSNETGVDKAELSTDKLLPFHQRHTVQHPTSIAIPTWLVQTRLCTSSTMPMRQ